MRDALRDYPKFWNDTWTADGTNGVIAAGASPVTLSKRPVYDLANGVVTNILVTDSTSSTTYTVVPYPTVPTAGQVQINYDTGELVFAAAPTSTHVIKVGYQYVKWRDQSIEQQLYAGLRAMFPKVGKMYTDTSIQLAVVTWDYQLPAWAQDPRSEILNVRVRTPNISVEPWTDIESGWRRIDLTTLYIPMNQAYFPGNLMVVGWGPYMTLGDLEPQLYELPAMYALSMLLPKEDTFRARSDTLVPLTQEGGQAPQTLTQLGDYWAKRFETELARLGRNLKPGMRWRMRTTYDARAR